MRVYDERKLRRLVAAVEIVSPRNKDLAESRQAFVSKCHALLQEGVCLVIVDPVTDWLTESLCVPLELEVTYEDTCRGLRIA